MDTKTENSKNNQYVFEKGGKLIKKITYKNNLIKEINDNSGGQFNDFELNNDFDGFLKKAKSIGYKIYGVVEL